MNITDTVLTTLESITGIEKCDLQEDPNLDLLENGILDSLSTVTMLSQLSQALNKELPLSQFNISDFKTVLSIVEAIERA